MYWLGFMNLSQKFFFKFHVYPNLLGLLLICTTKFYVEKFVVGTFLRFILEIKKARVNLYFLINKDLLPVQLNLANTATNEKRLRLFFPFTLTTSVHLFF